MGQHEFFKVELLLEFQQKKIFGDLEKRAKYVDKCVSSHLKHQWSAFMFLVPRESAIQYAKDLKLDKPMEYSLDHIANRAYDRFMELFDNGGSMISRASAKPGFELSPNDIIFSIEDSIVNIPMLGLTRYKPNNKFNIRYWVGEEVTEKKQDVNRRIRRAYLQSFGSIYNLVIEAPVPEKPQEKFKEQKLVPFKRGTSHKGQ